MYHVVLHICHSIYRTRRLDLQDEYGECAGIKGL